MAIELPEKFKEQMKDMLGNEYDSFLKSYEYKDKSGIRINTLKLSPEEFKKISPFELSPVSWIPTGYFYGKNDIPSKHPYYYAGLYYIQEPSAMTPASVFDVAPGHRVLDLCAAPGGKSTALAAKLEGKGLLVSNDVSNSRAKALLKNIELFGVRNALVLSETTSNLAKRFEGFFDRILVDAPCSGEGMFRKQPSIIKNWEQYGTGYYAKIQREILPDAIRMLRPGGKLLFSTCTFSPEEDEQTVAFILDNFKEMSLIDVFDEKDKQYYDKCGFSYGNGRYINRDDYDFSKCIRLFPHKVEGEGHFLCVLQKNPDALAVMSPTEKINGCRLPNEVSEFLDNIKFNIDKNRIISKDDRYYYVSYDTPRLNGLRILRNGLLLGEYKKNRFEPSQALACALNADEYSNVYNLSADDPRVIKYLKCESIDLPDAKDGYVLITCNGFSLGFAKVKKGNFKNKYLPGWRLM